MSVCLFDYLYICLFYFGTQNLQETHVLRSDMEKF